MEEILERIKRVAHLIEVDAQSPWNRDRAQELRALVEAAQRTRVSEQQVENAINDAFRIVFERMEDGNLERADAEVVGARVGDAGRQDA